MIKSFILWGSFVQCMAFLMLPWLMRHGTDPESYALEKFLHDPSENYESRDYQLCKHPNVRFVFLLAGSEDGCLLMLVKRG